jgi:hypothetical protein
VIQPLADIAIDPAIAALPKAEFTTAERRAALLATLEASSGEVSHGRDD